jgi:hypothetical protein
MDFTGDEGFDVIIEHLANINLAHDIQMIKKSKSYPLIILECQQKKKVRFLLKFHLRNWILSSK